MHSIVRLAALAGSSAMLLTATAAAQSTIGGVASGSGPLQRAATYLAQGDRDSAIELLSAHLAEQSDDGRAWFFLGRIYLDEAIRWHRIGHPDSIASATLLDFASTSFEPAQQLLTDSGGVFRVVVAVERATLRIERGGWADAGSMRLAPDEVPLPPVLAELGRNLLASCPRNGVLLTGSLAETASAWGMRLQGERSDLVLVRADMFPWDARYRSGMDSVLGAAAGADLPTALAAAAATRPICLAPGVDSVTLPGATWRPSLLVLTNAPPTTAFSAHLSVFHFGRTGLAGSVWTAAARDVYDLAARRNHALCSTEFVNTVSLTLPTIPACGP